MLYSEVLPPLSFRFIYGYVKIYGINKRLDIKDIDLPIL
jgi:hypothetical protein